MKEYVPTIGLEIHAELNTKSKMFCSCPNDPLQKQVNVNICPICLAHPGTLPVINKQAVEHVIKTGLALNCFIPEHSKFDRKNYFYPDLPKGYQISQYDAPLSENGYLNIGNTRIRIKRIHLEEDTGRLVHPKGADYSLIDFNRAGIPLMELVTEPDIQTGKQAREFAEEFQLILRYLGVSNADMEKGEMRVEVNISISPKESKKLGTKVEVKNLNSFRVVEKAIDYEIKRQKEVLMSAKKVIQETRGWLDKKEITISQRKKEEAHDYRYFPEPDLPPMKFGKKEIEKIRAEIPELPNHRRLRFEKEYGLSGKEVEVFIQDKELGEYFEKVVSELVNWSKSNDFFKLARLASNYIITDLQGLLKKNKVSEKIFLITPENFGEFVNLIYKKTISSKIAKDVLREMFSSGGDPSHIIEEKGLAQIIDYSEIDKIAKKVILNNSRAVEDFHKGKENALQFLIGQAMAETKGKVSPDLIAKTFKKLLLPG